MQLRINKKERDTLSYICKFYKNKISSDPNTLIEFLLKNFYNPSSSRKIVFEKLESINMSYDLDKKFLVRLKNLGLIEYYINKNIVIPTPLGIYLDFYDVLDDKNLIELINIYQKNLEKKLKITINEYGKKEKLTLKELAPVIFLLYNNNISSEQGYFKHHDIELKESIDRIISAFATQNPDSQGTKGRNGSLSGWYLTEANRKLGLAIYNQKNYYYIKPDCLFEVEKQIKNTIKGDPLFFKNSFEAFEKVFNQESKTLFEKGALYSTINSKEKVKKILGIKNEST